MTETKKPVNGWQPAKRFKRGTTNDNECLNLTTSTRTVQLFEVFDHDTKNAVIVTAGELSR
ncbi:MAG: hypothetical protein WC007_15045 [Pelobacteraceae bacterium]